MQTPEWLNGKKAALSFTFDDARQTQLTNAIPCLDQYGIKATFYVLQKNVERDVAGWQRIAQEGHEIGNHTISHPCSGNFAHSRHRALELFSWSQMEDEIIEANHLVKETLGVLPQTFAYPCGNSFVGRGPNRQSYVPLIAQYFKAGRATLNSGNAKGICDVSHLHAVGIDRAEAENLIRLIDQARANNEWLIFYGHELGDVEGHGMTTDTFDEVCRYARQFEDIWIDTVAAIASTVA
jgi:peptidoglycan/xylan/chitin deacetylase (PgdA/CDA1 family)